MKKRVLCIFCCLLLLIMAVSGCKKNVVIDEETGGEISVGGLFDDTSTPDDSTVPSGGDGTQPAPNDTTPSGGNEPSGGDTTPSGGSTAPSGGDETKPSGGGTAPAGETKPSGGDESKPADDGGDDKAGTVVKIITQNLLYDNGEGDYPNWKKAVNRKQYIKEVLSSYEADSMGFQETTDNWKKYLIEMFPGYQQVGISRFGNNNEANLPGSNEGDIIMFNADRLSLVEGKTWWLSDTPEVVGSETWGGVYPCTLTYAYLEIKDTKERFVHFTTHLSHTSEEARQKGAAMCVQLMEQFLAGKDDNALYATADWNFDEYSEGYATMNSYLNDSRQVSLTGDMWEPTFPAVGYGNPGSTIDFIFVNDFVAVDEYDRIDQLAIEGKYSISDHYGICITSRIYP